MLAVGIFLLPIANGSWFMFHVSCFMLNKCAIDHHQPSPMWPNYCWIHHIHYSVYMHNSICLLLTFIFLLYFGLFTVIGSLISILRSVAPERRRKFDVIFCANDGLRLLIFASFLHSFIITLESCSPWSLSVSSSFSANKIQNVICHFLFSFLSIFFLFRLPKFQKAHAVT